MKILQIRFLNLNSLAGNWFIDFTTPEIRNSGIFAITGPTGAGKTTILDAICLALYGKTPRLGHISKASNEIMTRHTGECFAEIEFLTSKGRYRCHWSQHRARKSPSGELQPQKHEIADTSSGRILESKIKLVEKKVVEVTGLDFEQFTRSILLAQGDFNTFLKSGPDQRAPILEQITGTEIYSRISKKVHEITVRVKTALEKTRIECQGFIPLSEEQLQELTGKINSLQHQGNELTLERQKNITLLNWYDEQEKLKEHTEELTKSLTLLKKEYELLSPEKERLNRAITAEKLKADYFRLTDTRKLQEEETVDLNHSIGALKSVTEKVMQQEQITKAHKQLLKAEKEKQLKNQKLFNDIRRRDQQIQHTEQLRNTLQQEHDNESQLLIANETNYDKLQRQISDITCQITELQQYFNKYKADEHLVTEFSGIRESLSYIGQIRQEKKQTIKTIEEFSEQLRQEDKLREEYIVQLDELNKQQDQLSKEETSLQIENTRLLSGHTPEQLYKNTAQLKDKLNTLERLRDAVLGRQKLSAEIVAIDEEKKKYTQSIKTTSEDREKFSIQLNKQKEIVNKQEQIVYLAAKVKNYEQERSTLIAGSPCPLCGSPEHPYVDGNEPEAGREQELLKKERLKQNALQQSLIDTTTKITEFSTLLNQYTQHQKTKLEELNAVTNQQRILQQIVSIDNESITVKQIENISKTLLTEIDSLDSRLDSYNQLSIRIKAKEQQKEQNEKKIASLTNSLEINHNRHQSIEEQLSKQKAQLEDIRKQLSQNTHLLETRLSPYEIPHVSEINEQELLAKLSSRKNLWQEKSAKFNALTLKQQTYQAEADKFRALIKNNKDKCTELSVRINSQSQQLINQEKERKKIFGTEDPDLLERRANNFIKTKEQELDSLYTQTEEYRQHHTTLSERVSYLKMTTSKRKHLLDELEKTFSNAIHDSFFTNENDYSSALLSDDELQSLKKSINTLDDEIKKSETLLGSRNNELQMLQAKSLTSRERTEILAHIEEIDKAITSIEQGKGAFLQKVRDNEQLTQQHAEKVEYLSQQQREYDQWSSLDHLIGSADGKKFRNFAQGLTFELMIGHANQSLRKMSDRYILIRDSEEPLELQIIDNYQAGEIRSIKNLSGGESFLVSLALALGLSSMASRNVQVDSLFLDEGFGTLDEESLQTALDILSSLHQEGKLIGIISHVSGLRERIPARINVLKGPGGRSRLAGAGIVDAAFS